MSSNPWKKAVDKRTGRIYYYNRETKATQWKAPPGFHEEEEDAGDKAPPTQPQKAPAAAAPAESKPQWRQVLDKGSGKYYYYNRLTKETRWSPPEDFVPANDAPQRAASKSTAAPVVAANAVDDPDDDDRHWREVVDPSSNRIYYYHRITKETRWTDPRKNKDEGERGPSPVPGSQAPPHKQSSGVFASVTPPESAPPKKETRTSVMLNNKALLSSDDDSDDDDSPGASARAAEPAAASKPETSDPRARMMEMKREADVATKKNFRELLDDSDEEEEDEEEFFVFAKHRKGWLNRTLRTGHVLDQEEIMSFKKSLIKKALLKRNRHLDAVCKQTFKNIMSYMGDRDSSKNELGHAQKLMRIVMQSPAGLRDEVYLQLCKQTTKNPRESSVLKGWELLVLSLSCFPPSKGLKKFLNAFLTENEQGKEAVSESTQEQIRRYCYQAAEYMAKITALGSRKEVPSLQEIESTAQLKDISIRVHFVDGTFKTLIVNSFTLASEVAEMLTDKLELKFTEPFGLFEETETGSMTPIHPKDRVLDIIARWEHIIEAEAEKKRLASKKKKPEVRAIAMEETRFRLVYKAKLMLKPTHPQIQSDPEAINLLYVQCVRDVVTAHYPVKEKHLTILAALQLQATFGDFHEDMHGHGWLLDKLETYVPAHMVTHKRPQKEQTLRAEWEQRILGKYAKVRGFTQLEAKINYLDYVQEWPYYGVTYFEVAQRQFKDYPSVLLLGITCEGCLLIHPESKAILDPYQYMDVVTWGHGEEKAILVVGNVVQQRKLVFKTEEGAEINQLIHEYVKFKVAEQSNNQ